MAPSRLALFAGSIATTLSLTFAIYYALTLSVPSTKRRRLRAKLPQTIFTWRRPDMLKMEEEDLWREVAGILRDAGLTSWKRSYFSILLSPTKYVLSSGFAYVTPTRVISDGLETMEELSAFEYQNTLSRAAQTAEGHAVIVRVVVIQDEGHEHSALLKRVATGPLSLLSNNHCLPLLREFCFEDIVFGVFPRAGGCLTEAFGYWAKNSVGDILDMILQALEGLSFLHELNIAHRDMFRPNLLIQWHPESLSTMVVPTSRPRVYIIDFEFSVEFASDCPVEDRVSIGNPICKWYPSTEYRRPVPPEVVAGKPYCPFKLDVWQLGTTFTHWSFETTIPAIDEVLEDMKLSDPAMRLSANEALMKLSKLVNNMSPDSLLIPPRFKLPGDP
ncbi:unnamed protein product [Somion occarium]|uniref:Protein kinase domain-containing protein n=1 Tax=Somion occarium TaxID=3059160 RepID=A0ABP1DUN8_9APHY